MTYQVQRLNDNGGWRHHANTTTLKGAQKAARGAPTATRILDGDGAVVKEKAGRVDD